MSDTCGLVSYWGRQPQWSSLGARLLYRVNFWAVVRNVLLGCLPDHIWSSVSFPKPCRLCTASEWIGFMNILLIAFGLFQSSSVVLGIEIVLILLVDDGHLAFSFSSSTAHAGKFRNCGC